MRLRLDGSETSFEESYPRAPFAPLIHLVVTMADALARWSRAGRAGSQVEPAKAEIPQGPAVTSA